MTIQRLQAQLHPVTNNKKHTQIDRGLQQSPSSKALTNLNFMGNNYKPISFKASLSEDTINIIYNNMRDLSIATQINSHVDRLNNEGQDNQDSIESLYALRDIAINDIERAPQITRILTEVLQNQNINVRTDSAVPLGDIAITHRDLAPEITHTLTQVFQDPNQFNLVRNDSAAALGNIASFHRALAPEITHTLTQVFQDPSQDGWVREESAIALGNIAITHMNLAFAIINTLTQVSQAPNQDNLIREESAKALRKIARAYR